MEDEQDQTGESYSKPSDDQKRRKHLSNQKHYQNTKEKLKVADQLCDVYIPRLNCIGEEAENLRKNHEELKNTFYGHLKDQTGLNTFLLEENKWQRSTIEYLVQKELGRGNQDQNLQGQIANPSLTLSPGTRDFLNDCLLEYESGQNQGEREGQHQAKDSMVFIPSGTVEVDGFKIAKENESAARKICAENRDMVANCYAKSTKVRNALLDAFCDAMRTLERDPSVIEAEDLEEADNIIEDLELCNFLMPSLKVNVEKVEAQKQEQLEKTITDMEAMVERNKRELKKLGKRPMSSSNSATNKKARNP